MQPFALYSLITTALGLYYGEGYFWLSALGWSVVVYAVIWRTDLKVKQLVGIWGGAVLTWQAPEAYHQFAAQVPTWVPWAVVLAVVVLLLAYGVRVAAVGGSALDASTDREDGTFRRHSPRREHRPAWSSEKLYLTVEFRQKNIVKAQGAQWDPVAKRWFTFYPDLYQRLCAQGFGPKVPPA